MAGLFNILKVTVSEDKICAHVLVNPGMPHMTSEDIEATARVYYLVPAIAKHLCLGDSGVSEHDERVFEVELSCPDDALAIGALSSATFMMDWAYLHADQPAPDVEGTVAGLRNLVLGMRAEAEGKDPHEAVAAANGEDAAEDEGADEGDVPVDAEPVADATAEPQGVPNFDDEPQVAIDTEGAVAENHEASAAVFGGAATVPAGPAHEGGLPLVDGAGEDPGATVAMPAMPQE